MPTAEELVVALRSEGATEVNSDLKTTEERMEETTDSAEKQSDRLGGFADKIKGAMAAIVAGLAIGAAGILSQVPVIGEAFAGLKSVFNAVTFAIDKQLRPGITKLNTELFELANAIMEGDYKQAKKEISDIGDAFTSLFQGVNFSKHIKNLQDVSADAIGNFISGLRESMNNVSQSDMDSTISTIINLMKRSLSKFIGATDWSAFLLDIIEFMGKLNKSMGKSVKNDIVDPLIDKIGDKWGSAIEGAKQWGKDIIDNIITGIENKAGELATAISTINIAGDLTVGDVADKAAGFEGGGGGSLPGSGLPGGRARQNVADFVLDGRKMTEDTGRYRSDASLRRGL
jgi:hypothetical protein